MLGLEIFSPTEKRNIVMYIIGIMLYKFGLESFNGTIKSYALDRLPKASRYEYTGYLDGFNQAAQCVGSILIAPLIRKFPTKTVLAFAMGMLAIIASTGMIAEAATGGKFPTSELGKTVYHYGTWNPVGVIPIFATAGIFHGMIELIRRVIPRDIVGGNVSSLKKMDAMVHIFYEISGTTGAFFSTYISLTLGKAYGAIVTPFCFIFAAVIWTFIRVDLNNDTQQQIADDEKIEGNTGVLESVQLFFVSFYEGGRIIFSDRRFTWLILGYSLPLFLHRYLENAIAANYAKLVLKESSYGQILVGGSNLGELAGAAFVFFFTDLVKTPLPWLRLDAITLTITWVFYRVTPAVLGLDNLGTAWAFAAILMPISMGWAAGDVSLAAFIQSHVSRIQSKKLSPLGAVMSFLYVSYIITFAIASPMIGKYIDALPKDAAKENPLDPTNYFLYFGGVMFTCCGVLIMAATFVPRGSWAFNPTILSDTPEYVDDVDGKIVLK